MAWYEVQLTRALVAANEHKRIQDRFEYFFDKLNAPRDMGMFSDQQPAQDLHLYFLLPAGDVSEAFVRVSGARPGGRPPATASLSVGCQELFECFRRGDPL